MFVGETTTPRTTSITDMNVITPKDFEEQCKQPIVIMTAVSMLIMIPVNILGMFAFFTRLEKMFNPNRIAATIRQRKFANRVAPRRA